MRPPDNIRSEIIKQLLLWTGICVSILFIAFAIEFAIEHQVEGRSSFSQIIPNLIELGIAVPPAGIIHYYWLHKGFLAKRKYGYYFLLLPLFVVMVIGINLAFQFLAGLFVFHNIWLSWNFLRFSWNWYWALDLPFILFYTTMRGMIDLKKRRRQQEAERKKTAILLLKSHLEPHFLFNTLNAVYATAQKEQAVKTLAGIDELSETARQKMAEDSKDITPTARELKSVQQRLLVEKKSKKYGQIFIMWSVFYSVLIIGPILSWSLEGLEPGRVFIYWPISCAAMAFTIVAHYYLLFSKYIPQKKYLKYILLLIPFLAVMMLSDWGVGEALQSQHILGDYPSNTFRDLMVSVVRVLLMELPIAFVYAMVRDYLKARRLRNYLEQEDRKNEELLLKNKLRPEFFNTALSNLQTTATQENAKQTTTLIGELKQLFRYSSEEAYQETVGMKDELDFIERYIGLQRIRISNSHDITIETKIHWDNQPANIAPMLLLPFIENAFKYGISYEEPSGISITIAATGKQLDCRISNTDHSGKNRQQSSGIGITNTIKRLELQYPGKYQLEQKNENGIYNVSLKLDLS